MTEPTPRTARSIEQLESRSGATDREVEARDAAGHQYFAGGGGGYVEIGETFNQELVGPSVAFRAGWTRSAEWHAARAAAAPDSGQRSAEERLAESLAFIGRWVDLAKLGESRESLEWRRVTKVCSEAGEAQDALDIATGGNPRKAGTKTYADVEKELLDAAGAALGAVEFLRQYDGRSLGLLVEHMTGVAARAALLAEQPGGGR